MHIVPSSFEDKKLSRVFSSCISSTRVVAGLTAIGSSWSDSACTRSGTWSPNNSLSAGCSTMKTPRIQIIKVKTLWYTQLNPVSVKFVLGKSILKRRNNRLGWLISREACMGESVFIRIFLNACPGFLYWSNSIINRKLEIPFTCFQAKQLLQIKNFSIIHL